MVLFIKFVAKIHFPTIMKITSMNAVNVNAFNDIRWMKDIFKLGLKGSILPEEIYKPKTALKSKTITAKFVELWSEELKNKHPSVLRVIFKSYGCSLLILGVLFSIIETTMRLVSTLYAAMLS